MFKWFVILVFTLVINGLLMVCFPGLLHTAFDVGGAGIRWGFLTFLFIAYFTNRAVGGK